MYRIPGGTTVCWRAVVGCGGGACVGVVRPVGGGVSCVVFGGSSWLSVVAVRGGWSWAWRFLRGGGTCGVGIVWGGGACVWVRVFALCSLRSFFICLSLASLFVHVHFFLRGGRVRVVGRFQCWAWAWVRANAGVGVGVAVVGDGWLLRSWFPVCVSAFRHLVASGFRGAGPGGAGGEWLAAVVAWCLRGRSRLLGSAWVAWPDVGVRVGVFMAWAVWALGMTLLGAGRLVWAWLVCVGEMGRGVGYVCAEGVVGWVAALCAMQFVMEMLVMPTGGGAVGAATGWCC